MKCTPCFKLIWLVCIVAASLPGCTSDSKASGENKPISNNVFSTADGTTQKDNILGDSIIPSVRNTWTRSRAILEKLWSKFRTSSAERSNRNLDSSLEKSFYSESPFFASDNDYYPPYLSRTKRMPMKRYPPPIPPHQAYELRRPAMPYYEDQFMYSQFSEDPSIPFYQDQLPSPYTQQPYRRRRQYRRPSYLQPPADDATWYYQDEPAMESNFQQPLYDFPRRFYRDRQSRTVPTELTDF